MTSPFGLPDLHALSPTRREIYRALLARVDARGIHLNMSTMRFDGSDGRPVDGEQGNLLDLLQYDLIVPAADYADGGIRPMSVTDAGRSFLTEEAR